MDAGNDHSGGPEKEVKDKPKQRAGEAIPSAGATMRRRFTGSFTREPEAVDSEVQARIDSRTGFNTLRFQPLLNEPSVL